MKVKSGSGAKTVIYAPHPLPAPWSSFPYIEFMDRRNGKLVADGRSSRVYFFTEDGEGYFLKRYRARLLMCWPMVSGDIFVRSLMLFS